MVEKEKLRPIYVELQGYLSQAPDSEKAGVIYDEPVWEQYNNTIEELKGVSEHKYDKFKVVPTAGGSGFTRVNVINCRNKLAGLISRLHAGVIRIWSLRIQGRGD